MRAPWRFALRSLVARKGRSAALVIAVALASALVVAMACGIATGEHSIDVQITRLTGPVNARIVHPYAAPFEGTLVDEVRTWPGVKAATGRLFGSLTLVRADGGMSSEGRPLRATVQARGLDVGADPRIADMELKSGRRPATAAEIAIDPATAKALRAVPGDMLVVQRLGDPIELVVSGIFDRPELGALQQALVQVDRATLARAVGRGDEITSIAIIVDKGLDIPTWCREMSSRVREPLQVEPAEMVRTGLDREARGANMAFLLGCMIGFLGCSFIVATGLTTALAEQTREMGILRSIGAARQHLFTGQLLTGAMIALPGGLLGVPLGLALTQILVWYWHDLLRVGVVVSWAGIAIAIGGSLAAGLAGAAHPAVVASRVAPLEALRVRTRLPRPGGAWLFAPWGFALLALQLALLLVSDRDSRFWTYMIVGLPAMSVAWLLLSVPGLRIITAAVAPALGRVLRLPAGLLASATATSPYRMGLTAGALMVGVAILVSTWSNGVALLQEVTEKVRFADAFVFKTSGLSPGDQKAIREIPGIASAIPIGYLPVKVIGRQIFGAEGLGPSNVTCVGFDPDEFFRLNRIEWIQGTPDAALPKVKSGEAVLVAREFLNARGLKVGDRILLGGAKRNHEFEIAGVVSAAGLDVVTQFFGIRSVYSEQAASCLFMDFGAVAKYFDTRDAYIMQIDLGPSATDAGEKAVGDRISDLVPGAIYSSGRAIKRSVTEIGRTALNLSSGVSFAALVLAAFGVGNVVAAGIAARRFEFGVLRAVGGARGVIARLILGEVTLMALTGSVSGTFLGLQMAWMGIRFYHDMAGIDLNLVLPWGPALVGYAALLVVAIVASLPPLVSLLRRPTRDLLAAQAG